MLSRTGEGGIGRADVGGVLRELCAEITDCSPPPVRELRKEKHEISQDVDEMNLE